MMTSDGERARGAAVFFKTKQNQNLFQISTGRRGGGEGKQNRSQMLVFFEFSRLLF